MTGMDVEWSIAVWSGLVATVAAAVAFWGFESFGLTEFTPARSLAGLVARDPRTPLAETLGQLTFLLLGSTVFAAAYVLILESIAEPDVANGAALGTLHGLLAVLSLPLLRYASRGVRSGSEVAPGRLGLAWGRGTPIGVLVGHAVYGAVLGASVSAFQRG
ncbi:hypothetical protein BH20GEM2_BH20GEM2_16110 [soil metagenome]